MPKPGKLRCLEDFRRAETSTWTTADDVADDIRDRMPDAAARTAANLQTGSRQVLADIEHDLAVEGIETKASYLRELWETSDSWPPEDRFPVNVAPFSAHKQLRSLKWENRRDILAQLIEKHGGRVSQRDVIRWRQGTIPPKRAVSWRDETVRMIDLLITRRIGDRRNRTVAEARQMMAEMLRDAADQLDAIGT
jgi:hypothetical protein